MWYCLTKWQNKRKLKNLTLEYLPPLIAYKLDFSNRMDLKTKTTQMEIDVHTHTSVNTWKERKYVYN